MSKVNQIEEKILTLEGGRFQRLANSYLHMRGYQNFSATGSVIASDKTKKGTPDTFITLPNGKFIFVEHTTEQNNIEKKLNGDLDKCLDVKKHGIPLNEIEEIIFCHTAVLSAEEERALRKRATDHGVKISIFGLSTIALDLSQKYPGIAHDHLGIEIDKGQIISPAALVEKSVLNQIATPLNTTLMFRDSELSDLVNTFEKEDLIVLSGPAGVGKSRLALESLKKYKEKHNEFELFCVVNGSQDLFNDLQTYFKKPGKFLILVDDANRVSKFDYITDLILNKRDDQEIKVISTVRDYASDKIQNSSMAVKKWTTRKIDILKDDQIKEIVKVNYKITNPIFLDRIADISKGNPRLAIMSAKIASETNNFDSIRDVSLLYDLYFQSIRQDLEALGNENIIKVAGAISFFRNVDKTNKEMMEAISRIFNIAADEFWSAVRILHRHELVDLYEDEVVKISDQVLATYLFYLYFFKNQNDNFNDLFEQTFPQYEGRLRDAIYPCLNAFNPDDVISKIQKAVKEKWKAVQDNGDLAEKLIHLFWFILPTDSLLYIKRLIESTPTEAVDPFSLNWAENNIPRDDTILNLLKLFSHAREKSEISTAIAFMCDYVQKNQKAALSALSFLTKDFGFTHTSHWSDYRIPKLVIETLHTRFNLGKNALLTKLYIEVGQEFLATRHDSTSSGKHAITIHQFELLPRPPIFEIRKTILEDLFSLFKDPFWQAHVLKILNKYANNSYGLSQKDIVEKDAEIITPFIRASLDPKNLQHVIIVHNYLSLLGDRKITVDLSLATSFTNKSFELYNLLSRDTTAIVQLGYKEAERVKKEELLKHTEKFKLDDYKTFISQFSEMISIVSDHDAWQLNGGMITVLISLAERDTKIYTELMEYYLSLKNPFEISQPQILVSCLVKCAGKEKALEIISQADYPHKSAWTAAYLMSLREDQIKSADLKKLYNLYQTEPLNYLPRDWDFLLKYKPVEAQIIAVVAEILIKRAETDSSYGHAFDLLFNPHAEVNKTILESFKDKIDIFKKAYIAHITVDKMGDYDCRTLLQILNQEPSFIEEYIDIRYSQAPDFGIHDDGHNYASLWRSSNGKEIMRKAIMRAFKHEEERGYYGSYLEHLLCLDHSGEQPGQEITTLQDELLVEIISDESKNVDLMKFVFDPMAHFDANRKKKFISLFLEKNKSYEAFEQLPLEPDHCGWSGSAVPLIASRIEFLQSLLPLLNSAEFLQHKKHVEQIIDGHQKWLEREKKSDFLDD